MKISDLKADSSFDEIILKIIEKEDERNVIMRYGGYARVCNAIGKDDDENRIKITLWNDEIDEVEVGSIIKIKNGWVKKWNDELQISTGRHGEIIMMKNLEK